MGVQRVQFEARDGGLVAAGAEGDAAFAVRAMVVTSGKRAAHEMGKAAAGKDGSVALQNADGGVRLVLGADGEVRAEADGARVKQVRLLFKGSWRDCFAQGYQTWNLSSGYRIGRDSRVKSIASRLGLSGMFQDTDHAVWRQKGSGVESHGVVLLSGSGAGDPSLMIGAASCRAGTTAFWTEKAGRAGTASVRCVIDYGEPGVAGPASETLVMALDPSPQALLEQYSAAVVAHRDDTSSDASLAMSSPLRDLGRAPVGWGSWYEFYEHVKAKDVADVLGAINKDEQLKPQIDVFQLDDGYQLNTGDWLETQPSFGESDLSKIARKIAAEGFTPGLWVAPFIASKTSKLFRAKPHWFVRKVDNPKAFVRGHFNPAWKRKGSTASQVMYILDCSNPEVLEHLEKTFRELAKHWKFFKIDFLAAGMREGIRINGGSMTRVQAYIEGVRAVRRGIGADSFLLGCGAPLLPSAQSNCFDSMRVSCDTAERWTPPRLLRMLIHDWAIPCCSNALWGNMTRYFMHDTMWRFNDPDCLVLRRKGNSMTEWQIKTQVTVLGLTGGLLLFTDNMATLAEDRKRLAFGVLPTTSLRGRPVQDLATPKSPPTLFELNDIRDTAAHAVGALINWGKAAREVMAPRDGFDFWAQRRVARGDLVTLAPYGVCALQAPAEGSLLIGTTLHLTALADQRVRASPSGEGVRVDGAASQLALRRGLLVFDADADVLSVAASEGLSVERSFFALPGGAPTCAVEVQLDATASSWSLTVQRRKLTF